MAHKKSRKHDFGRGSGGGVNLGLIITPMLDMAFQLLAFFVMTYHPPVNVGFVEGDLLPPTKEVEKKVKEKEKPKGKEKKDDKTPKEFKDKIEDKKPEDKTPEQVEEDEKVEVVRVTVRAVKDDQREGDREGGDPNAIDVHRDEGTMTLMADANLNKKDFVSALKKELSDKLKEILEKAKKENKTPELRFEVDGKLKHRYWLAFRDTCIQSGFNNIRFVAPPAEPQVQAK
jgi:biopolymer transport protein ExbD